MTAKLSKRKRRPTMYDVAKLAGVSQTTVSFVVNDTDGSSIPEETKQRVWDAIKTLGYRPNVLAKHLFTQQTQTIGFITDHVATGPHAGKLILGAQDEARTVEKIILLTNTGDDPEFIQSAIETMLERQVDGIIYATVRNQKVNPPAILRETSTVLLNCYDEEGTFPAVVPDEVNAGRTATEVLLRKGHRRIAFLNGTSVEMEKEYWKTFSIDKTTLNTAARGRERGYKQAMVEYGVPSDEELICYIKANQNSGYHATHHLMQLSNPPTAIFCFNDQIALGVYDGLCDLGLRIPADVAVMGFDNIDFITAYMRPSLSTMQLSHYRMGQLAVKLLTKMVEDDSDVEPLLHRVECPYIERESI